MVNEGRNKILPNIMYPPGGDQFCDRITYLEEGGCKGGPPEHKLYHGGKTKKSSGGWD